MIHRKINTHDFQTFVIGNSFAEDIASFLMPHLKHKTVLLVTGLQSFDKTPQSHYLQVLFDNFNTKIIHTTKIGENPVAYDILGQTAGLNNFDCILAIGGGSVIDAAKKILHDRMPTHGEIPFYAIYTRPGSGTTVTPFFIYNNEEFKIGEYDPKTVPRLVYASAELMHSLSRKQRYAGYADILAHLTESHLSKNCTPTLKVRTRELIMSMSNEINDLPLEMLISLEVEAGLIESHCLVLLPHALGHYLTYTTGLTHGIASIVTLKPFIELCLINKVIDVELADRIINLADNILDEVWQIDATALRNNLASDLPKVHQLIHKYMPFIFELNSFDLSYEAIESLLIKT